MTGSFVVSLDFELLWGVRDHSNREKYGKNILGARNAVPRILELFVVQNIRATWATVGFLFCEHKDELLACIPDEQPRYANARLSNYSYFDEVGADEHSDPYYFASSLIKEIANSPGQEIGTQTLSHFYCLEDGQTLDAFEADLVAAQKLANAKGISLKSIVFPRNQFSQDHLEVCAKLGITHYRGNPTGWAYKAAKGADQTPARRALRLIDAYSGIFGGAQAFDQGLHNKMDTPKNVPASRFLRPCAGCLAAFHPAHIATIKRGMTAAARMGRGYHLWWHPHNFGSNLNANMAGLCQVIKHFLVLHDNFGMQSLAMEDF